MVRLCPYILAVALSLSVVPEKLLDIVLQHSQSGLLCAVSRRLSLSKTEAELLES